MSDPHAVRWATRELKRLMDLDYTKWHYTNDASFTVCGLSIPVGNDNGTFLPETDDEVSRVNCKKCLGRITQGSKLQ